MVSPSSMAIWHRARAPPTLVAVTGAASPRAARPSSRNATACFLIAAETSAPPSAFRASSASRQRAAPAPSRTSVRLGDEAGVLLTRSTRAAGLRALMALCSATRAASPASLPSDQVRMMRAAIAAPLALASSFQAGSACFCSCCQLAIAIVAACLLPFALG